MLLAVLLLMGLLAAVAPVLDRLLGRNAGFVLSAGFLGAGALALSEAPAVLRGEPVTTSLPWLPALDVGLELRMDGLALLFTVLVLGVGALVMAYSARYLSTDRPHALLFSLLTLFAAAMLGLVLSADLVLLVVFWELTSICSFFLIGGRGGEGARPAMRALVITGGGGLCLLAAAVLLLVVTGTTHVPTIVANRDLVLADPLSGVAAVLVVVAAMTKSAQLPFHFWLPQAMVALTPVSAYLHAATMVKAGIYLLLRFSPVFAGTPPWFALIVVGLASALVGAVVALKQHDLKALLAWSTVSQLGFLVALTGVGTTAAIGAAVVHTFAHALFKATLFMLVGIVDRQAGSRDIRQLGGLRKMLPVTATLTALAALSLAGVPPTIGFVSKEGIFDALLDARAAAWTGPAAAAVAVVAAGFTFAYGVRLFWGAFAGEPTQELHEPRWTFLAPAAVTAVLSLALGPIAHLLNPAATRIVRDTAPVPGAETDLALWHGLNAALALSVVTYVLGTLLFLAGSRVEAGLQRLRAPATGAGSFDAAYDATLRLGHVVAGVTARRGPAAQLTLPVLAVLLGAAAAAARWPVPLDPVPAATRDEDWVVVALVAVAVLALSLAGSKLAAMVLLGLVGFTVALWFQVAGAPDLVLTQVLVEILTVVVAALVLHRLGPRFVASTRARHLGSGALALAGGTAAALVTLGLTGRRPLSDVGEHVLTRAPEETGGTNAVNTILVDYRALDTLGEITVLAVVALGVLALVPPSGRPSGTPGADGGVDDAHVDARRNAGADARADAPVILPVTTRVLVLPLLLLAAYLFLRGHHAPGGGFIAALVAGAGVALLHLTHGPAGTTGVRLLRPVPLLGAGLTLAVVTGLGGYLLGGAFLAPAKAELAVPGLGALSLSSSLLFDLGVSLVVVALVIATLERLGDLAAPTAAVPAPAGAAGAPTDTAPRTPGPTAAATTAGHRGVGA